jgi:hypothetical protein
MRANPDDGDVTRPVAVTKAMTTAVNAMREAEGELSKLMALRAGAAAIAPCGAGRSRRHPTWGPGAPAIRNPSYSIQNHTTRRTRPQSRGDHGFTGATIFAASSPHPSAHRGASKVQCP